MSQPTPLAIPRAQALRHPSLMPVTMLCGAVVMSVLAHDWIAGFAVLLLWAAWRYLQPEIGPPVLPLAFSFQWLQVVAGIFYYAITGRQVAAMYETDYRPMVIIGLVSLCALLGGLRCGMSLIRLQPRRQSLDAAFSWPTLIQLYLVSVMLAGFLHELAFWIPQLTQPIIISSFIRFGLLFLILRRLSRPRVRWGWVCTILTGEVLLGFTGFFAEFREALAIGALALLEVFDRRRLHHWVGLGVLGGCVLLTGLLWMAIRSEYRGELTSGALVGSRLERLERIEALTAQWLETDLASAWADADATVHRLWAVYYPALAISRVPAVLPYEHGAIFMSAVRHVLTPRLFFPEKENPPSDSEMVRRYSGVRVAGPEQGTTIAFGYAAESYVDFGIPWMFVPIFFYGMLMGVIYRWFLHVIRLRELAVALVSVVFWLSLYQFERSWLKTLGLSGTMIVYLGGAVILLDRYISILSRRQLARARAVQLSQRP
jgi:hypothetical protein